MFTVYAPMSSYLLFQEDIMPLQTAKTLLTTLHHDLIGLTLNLALQSQFTAGSFEVLFLHRWALLLFYLAWLQ